MERLYSVIREVVEIMKPILSDEMFKTIIHESENINKLIDDNRHIKVPIVGDFNTGKTSLINILLEGDGSLPVDIVPETAIPCEIHPVKEDENPHVVVFRHNEELFNGPIEEYKSVNVRPGDYAIVYTSSSIIRKWYDKGVILVDMPGVSSGIKAHNESILRYISHGTIYAFLVDSAKGAITKSNEDFISEIMRYGLSMGVFMSRADLVHSSENLNEIKNYISNQVSVLLNDPKVGVIVTKSVEQNDVADFVSFIDGINANDAAYQKLLPIVRKFLADQIIMLKELDRAINASSNSELEGRIEAIKNEIVQIKESTDQSLKSIDDPEKSTNDILDDIRDAIKSNASYVAEAFIQSSKGNRNKDVNDALLRVIRPALVNSFKQEQEELIIALNTKIDNLTGHILESIQDSTNIFDDLISKNENTLVTGMRIIAERIMQLDKPWAQVAGHIIYFIAEAVPNVLRQILGRDKDELRDELVSKVRNTICNDIIGELRTPVRQQVLLMQQQVINITREEYAKKINRREVLLEELNRQKDYEREQIESKSESYINAINALESMCEQFKC